MASGEAAQQSYPLENQGGATEEIQAPLAALTTPDDLHQAAEAEKLEASHQRARQCPFLLPSATSDAGS